MMVRLSDAQSWRKVSKLTYFFLSRFGGDAGRVSYGPGGARDELADGRQYLFFCKGKRSLGFCNLKSRRIEGKVGTVVLSWAFFFFNQRLFLGSYLIILCFPPY